MSGDWIVRDAVRSGEPRQTISTDEPRSLHAPVTVVQALTFGWTDRISPATFSEGLTAVTVPTERLKAGTNLLFTAVDVVRDVCRTHFLNYLTGGRHKINAVLASCWNK
jgi:hypothetical protein